MMIIAILLIPVDQSVSHFASKKRKKRRKLTSTTDTRNCSEDIKLHRRLSESTQKIADRENEKGTHEECFSTWKKARVKLEYDSCVIGGP